MKKLLSIGLGIMLFISSIGISSANESINVSRVSGYDRYETAVNANKKFMDHANGNLAVISSGSDFKTALYASHMASALKVPYFVNPKHGVRTDILNEMQRLNVSRVYVVGDYKVLDRSVDNTLKSKGMKLQRIYQKNKESILEGEIDNVIFRTFNHPNAPRGDIGVLALVDDSKFPDLLSVAPFMGQLAREQNIVMAGWRNYDSGEILEDLGYIIGGYNSVPSNFRASFYTGYSEDGYFLDYENKMDSRIYGQNRYETAVEVAKGYKTYLNKDIKTIVLVNGEDYPDALSSSLVATQNNGAVLLTQSNKLNKDTAKYIKDSGIKNIIIVGGEKSVSKSVENELRNLYLK